MQTLEQRLQEHTQTLEQLSQQQKEAADKMTPLEREGDEGQLRQRLVAKIQQWEDERDRLAADITHWQQDLQTVKDQIEQHLQQLHADSQYSSTRSWVQGTRASAISASRTEAAPIKVRLGVLDQIAIQLFNSEPRTPNSKPD